MSTVKAAAARTMFGVGFVVLVAWLCSSPGVTSVDSQALLSLTGGATNKCIDDVDRDCLETCERSGTTNLCYECVPPTLTNKDCVDVDDDDCSCVKTFDNGNPLYCGVRYAGVYDETTGTCDTCPNPGGGCGPQIPNSVTGDECDDCGQTT